MKLKNIDSLKRTRAFFEKDYLNDTMKHITKKNAFLLK